MKFYIKSSLLTIGGFLLISSGWAQFPTQELGADRYSFAWQGKYGIADGSGKPITDPLYHRIFYHPALDNSLVIVQKDSLLGFVDIRTGQEIISPRYKRADYFHEGLAAVSEDGRRWGYIDPSGNWQISPQWDMALEFRSGMAKVINARHENERDRLQLLAGSATPTPGICGYIDRRGEYVIPMNYSYIDGPGFGGGLLRFTRGEYRCSDPNGFCDNPYPDSKWGLMNYRGEIVLADDQYDYIMPYGHLGNIYYILLKDKQSGLADSSLSFVLPLGSFSNYQELRAIITEAIP